MCLLISSLVFYKTFFRAKLSFFFSKSKVRILDKLRVSFKIKKQPKKNLKIHERTHRSKTENLW